MPSVLGHTYSHKCSPPEGLLPSPVPSLLLAHLKGPVYTLMPSTLDRTDANRFSALVEHSASGVWTAAGVWAAGLPAGGVAASRECTGGLTIEADMALCIRKGPAPSRAPCGEVSWHAAAREVSEEDRRRHAV